MSFRDLLVWQQAIDLVIACHQLTDRFPKDELHCMTSQIWRAAASVPANIAEGNGAVTRKHQLSYLRTAEGSLAELETYVVIATRLRYADEAALQAVEHKLHSVSRLLHRLMKSISEKERPDGS